MKIAVLGAGVSGLTAARLLSEKGHNVIVYEKNTSVGGLARSRFVDGLLYDPHGGHIFNSKHSKVVDFVFARLPRDKWQFTVRNAKIFFNGSFISYPFELSLCELDAKEAVDCIYDFILAQNGDEPNNYRDWLIWNFGKAISDYYMIPYNEKIWAYPLEKMETQWVKGKMPLPSKKEIIHSMLLKDPTEREMPHSTFYYPIEGGIQSMVNAIAFGLNIKCGYNITRIKKENGKWVINNEFPVDLVISTIPLPDLPNLMQLPESVINSIQDLKYNSLNTILFECEKTDISWLYIPSHSYSSHRVGYQSSLTPKANPNPQKGAASLEVIGEKINVNDVGFDYNKVLPKELGFKKAIDSEFTKYAYVIHDLNYRRNISNILGFFSRDTSFKLLGRWGTWNYKNMDLCMLDAMELVEQL